MALLNGELSSQWILTVCESRPHHNLKKKTKIKCNIRLCICTCLFSAVFFKKSTPAFGHDHFLAMSTMRSRCRSTALAVFCAAWTLSGQALSSRQLFAMPTGGADGEVQEKMGQWGGVEVWGQHRSTYQWLCRLIFVMICIHYFSICIYLSIYLSICLFFYLSIYLSIYLSTS